MGGGVGFAAFSLNWPCPLARASRYDAFSRDSIEGDSIFCCR